MTELWCDNDVCKHNAGGRGCKLKTVRVQKIWKGSLKDWTLLCLDTTDRTLAHEDQKGK